MYAGKMRSATLEGQKMRSCWNSHVRAALLCMGGSWIQIRHL